MQSQDMKILVVDDYNTMRRIIEMTLNEIGFQHIYEAADGYSAMDILQKEGPFGLIISDFHMLPMNGLELLSRVRGNRDLRKIPYIIITAETHTDAVEAAMQAGVSGYVIKPFDTSSLREKIEEFVPSLHD